MATPGFSSQVASLGNIALRVDQATKRAADVTAPPQSPGPAEQSKNEIVKMQTDLQQLKTVVERGFEKFSMLGVA